MHERLVDVVVGLQRGDEGKGRIVDRVAEAYDVVARFNGGNNAGHTIVTEESVVLKLNTIPSGIAREGIVNVVGNGVFVNPSGASGEIEEIESHGIEISRRNLLFSSAAHIIMPEHVSLDEIREAGQGRQGSTKKGISQVAGSKVARHGVRLEMINNHPDQLEELAIAGLEGHAELRKTVGLDQQESFDAEEIVKCFMKGAKKIGQFVTDTVFYLNQRLASDAPPHVLAEGAQAFLLDVDHGMYPEVTSTGTTSGAVAQGLGIPPKYIGGVTGVAKATQSHVGEGIFVTEIPKDSELYDAIHGDISAVDAEYGTTTGRKRRIGHLDLPQIRRANLVNGTEELVLTKVDWLDRYGSEIPVCVAYAREKPNGSTKIYRIAPDSARKLEQCRPLYYTLNGWEEDISEIKDYASLPENTKKYIEFIEEQTAVRITMMGVGPRRDQVITKTV